MALIDTHCHYNLDPLWSNWQNHWQAAQANGVMLSIMAGADQQSCERGLLIAQQEPKLLAALGFHPEVYDDRTTQLKAKNLDQTEILAETEKILQADVTWLTSQTQLHKIVAIGETGLDYYYFNPTEPELNALKISAQKSAFIAQIDLANQLKLPLIVHTRDKGEAAYRDALDLIKQHYLYFKPFVLHCVSGPIDCIAEAIKLGGYIGFDGNLTYKKNQALVEIFQSVPTERILLETDAPFLPPQEYRGQTCEPWMVGLTASYIEANFGLNKNQLTTNALACFDLDPSIMG